jgi:hypothetical protein
MKKYMAWGILIAFLSAHFMGGVAFAVDRAGADPTDGIPVVGLEPVQPQPTGDGSQAAPRSEAPEAAVPKEPVDGGAVIFDILLLRPVGIVACGLGVVAGIVALPFAIPTGSTGQVMKALVGAPFVYTFVRPVGQLQP